MSNGGALHRLTEESQLIFNDPAHYDALVLQCGWPELAYTEWLSREMRNALPGADGAPRRAPRSAMRHPVTLSRLAARFVTWRNA